MNNQRKLWGKVAPYYDVIWQVADYSRVLQSAVKEANIDLGMRVIDVATGTGIVGLEAARKVGLDGNVVCIDYSTPMLEKALEKARLNGLRNVDFVLADAHNTPFLNNCFDAVTCCWGFSFFSNPHKVANEMNRIAKPSSKVAIVEWAKPPVQFWLDLRRQAGIRDFEESELVGILHDARLRDVHTSKIRISHRRPDVSQELIKKS
jgi:ubiquinone/menaquinone biosynthesis C-methylase UbiE